MQYQLPANCYQDWNRNQTRAYVPDARQQLVIASVRRATTEAGLYYTKDVYEFCKKDLLPSEDVLQVGAKSVEGGEFGMDLYYARQYLDAQRRFVAEDDALSKLRPQVGMKLGTLVLQDFKRFTSAQITAIAGTVLTVQGKRGAVGMQFTEGPLTILHAMNRAHERGARKDNFEQFCAALLRPDQRATTGPGDRQTIDLLSGVSDATT